MSSPLKNEKFAYTCLLAAGIFFAAYILFSYTCSKKDHFIGSTYLNDKPVNTIYNKYDQVFRNNEAEFRNAFTIAPMQANESMTSQEQGVIDGLDFYKQFTNQPMRIDKSLIYQNLVADGYNKMQACEN